VRNKKPAPHVDMRGVAYYQKNCKKLPMLHVIMRRSLFVVQLLEKNSIYPNEILWETKNPPLMLTWGAAYYQKKIVRNYPCFMSSWGVASWLYNCWRMLKIQLKSSVLMVYVTCYGLQKDWSQLMATGLLTVFKYLQNEATDNWTDPKCGQPQPKNGLDQVSVQFGPRSFVGPMDWTFKH
jgi:hypothetical protein